MHFLLQAVAIVAVLALGAFRVVASTRSVDIEHNDTDNLWHYRTAGGSAVEGTLVDAGYRSAIVVVLVLQTDHLACHRFPVWRDQLPVADYSYLHHQLQFNTVPRKRGSWGSFAGRLRDKPHRKLVQ